MYIGSKICVCITSAVVVSLRQSRVNLTVTKVVTIRREGVWSI